RPPPPAAEPASPSIETLTPAPGTQRVEPPVFVPVAGDPPIWGASQSATEDVMYEFLYPFGDPRNLPDLPPDCVDVTVRGEEISPHKRDCIDRVLTGRGVTARALEFYWASNLSIYSVEGPGPVWLAHVMDWRYFSSNGVNADAIFATGGIIEPSLQKEWPPYVEAIAQATDTGVFTRIADALAPELTDPWGDPGPPLGFAQYGGQDTALGPPVRFGDGWAVPVTLWLASCHACGFPFAIRISFDFDGEGYSTGVRFLGWCHGTVTPTMWTNGEALAAIAAELQTCPSTPTL
ncbi:MAG: hypothetical protein ACKOD2_13950, partial [Ilumatobacteraceae bacterium]